MTLALGATPQQVRAGLAGAILGLPLGIGLSRSGAHGLSGLPQVLWLVAAALGTLFVVAALTSVRAWIGIRPSVAELAAGSRWRPHRTPSEPGSAARNTSAASREARGRARRQPSPPSVPLSRKAAYVSVSERGVREARLMHKVPNRRRRQARTPSVAAPTIAPCSRSVVTHEDFPSLDTGLGAGSRSLPCRSSATPLRGRRRGEGASSRSGRSNHARSC